MERLRRPGQEMTPESFPLSRRKGGRWERDRGGEVGRGGRKFEKDQGVPMSEDQTPDTIESIAIIGMAGRFPEARDLDELLAATCATASIASATSRTRSSAAGLDPATLPPDYVRCAAPRRRHRALRRRASSASRRARPRSSTRSSASSWSAPGRRWRAPATIRRARPGLGRRLRRRQPARRTTCQQPAARPEPIAAHGRASSSSSPTTRDYFATRVSYKLDLRGPSAQRADRLLDLAGRRPPGLPEPARLPVHRWRSPAASRLSVPQKTGYSRQQGGIFSPDGHCRSFDAKGQGALFGERRRRRRAQAPRRRAGRRRPDPRRDPRLGLQQRRRACKVGYTAPSIEGQAEVIALAQAVAGVDPARSPTSRRTAAARRWAIRSRSRR